MNLRTRLRLAWAVARDVLRAPVMPTGPSGAVWGWSYGSPDKETPWGTFDDFAIGGYGGNAVVFGLIRTRMNAFSEARFRFRSLEDKRLQDPNDPALNKLANPWPGATTGELLMRMEIDASLAGNAFVRDAGDRLERLRPDWVTIISEVEHDDMGREVRTVVGYLYEPYGDPDRGVEIYDVDEVAHWSPIPDPIANFRGMSWLTPVLTEVEADNAQTIHRGAYYRNAASPNLILKYAQKLKQEHIEAIAAQVHKRHGGAENAFRTMVLDVGADPMIVGTALSDSTFSAVQAAGELRVAMASGVPPIVAGLAGGLAAGTHSNYEQAVRQFADMTLRPNWRGACAALAKLIEVPDGAELWFDAGDVALLQEGENSQATTFQVKAASISTLIQAGYEPESVGIAVKAGDEALLKHTGLVSVQMHNANEPEKKPDAAPPAQRSIERRFDPMQKRDPDGQFSDGNFPARAAGDRLGLAKRIRLRQGDVLVGSAKVQGNRFADRSAVLAAVDTPYGRRVRLGIVRAEDSRRWSAGNRGSTVDMSAAEAATVAQGLRDVREQAVRTVKDYRRDVKAAAAAGTDFPGFDQTADGVIRAGEWGDVAWHIETRDTGEPVDGIDVTDIDVAVSLRIRPAGAGADWEFFDETENFQDHDPASLARLIKELDRLSAKE